MKRILVYFISIILLTSFFYLIFKNISLIKQKEKLENSAQNIPLEFELYKLTGEVFKFKNFNLSKPIIIIHFNTECEYCHHELKSVIENIKKLNEFNIVCISSEKPSIIEQFIAEQKINYPQNLIFLSDKKKKFFYYFGTSAIPSTFMYGVDGKLKYKQLGEVSANALLTWSK